MSPIRRLGVLRAVRPETAHSPELSYLRSTVLAEIRCIFREPRIVELELPAAGGDGGGGGGGAEGAGGAGGGGAAGTGGASGGSSALDPGHDLDAVLVLADDRVLIGRATLAAMRAAVEGGAGMACPRPVAEVATEPLYSLRDFERVEQAMLAAPAAQPPPASHLPVSLWSRAALATPRALETALPPAWLLSEGPEGPVLPAGRTWAGLYHRFIDYYAEVRADILPLVPAGAREVLEIGCGRGLTGRLLRERLGCRVTGVELNAMAARDAAANLDAVIVGDVESLAVPGRYDLVVALELFEHLVRQEEFLDRMRQLLNPGGAILLSVPNVGHYSVVRDLLAGRWDYLPIGLLCFTHYRFFTRATLLSWFQRCGFSAIRLEAQTTELPEEFARLAAGAANPAGRPALEIDIDSLRTKGFYAILQP
jgi:SAM-dependent methyltransferase